MAKKATLVRVDSPKRLEQALKSSADALFHYVCRRTNALQTLKEKGLLDRIRELEFCRVSLADERIDVLVEEPDLEHVHTLFFDTNKMKDGLRRIADSPCLTNLEHLKSTRNQLTSASLEALSGSACGDGLESLTIYFEKLGADELRALMSGTTWPSVTHLELNYCQLKSDALVELCKPDAWGSLTSLNLTTNKIDAEGLAALVEAPFASRLTKLNLHYNRIGDDEAAILAGAPSLSNLETLILTDNSKLSPKGKEALAESEHLSEKIRKKFGA